MATRAPKPGSTNTGPSAVSTMTTTCVALDMKPSSCATQAWRGASVGCREQSVGAPRRLNNRSRSACAGATEVDHGSRPRPARSAAERMFARTWALCQPRPSNFGRMPWPTSTSIEPSSAEIAETLVGKANKPFAYLGRHRVADPRPPRILFSARPRMIQEPVVQPPWEDKTYGPAMDTPRGPACIAGFDPPPHRLFHGINTAIPGCGSARLVLR